jgi:adenylate kinase
MRNKTTIVLLGPPASGKGTQAHKIAQFLGGHHLSTGYYLRQAVAARTPLGIEAQRYVDAGELVPDSLVFALLRDTLLNHHSSPVILDGFPRTLSQAQALDTFRPPDAVLYIELDSKHVLERITGRRIGPHGEPYHIVHNPPPPGIEVTQRSDDREEVARERLEVYYRQTEPLLSYYAEKRILWRVPGEGSIDEVFARMVPVLEAVVRGQRSGTQSVN